MWRLPLMQAIAGMTDPTCAWSKMLSSYLHSAFHSISFIFQTVPGLIWSALSKLRYPFEIIKYVIGISLPMK